MIRELDCVALAADLPDYGLAVGDVGAVVHIYEGGHSYQIEVTAFVGRTVAVVKVSANQIRFRGDQADSPRPPHGAASPLISPNLLTEKLRPIRERCTTP
jgi:hypothetical protein